MLKIQILEDDTGSMITILGAVAVKLTLSLLDEYTFHYHMLAKRQHCQLKYQSKNQYSYPTKSAARTDLRSSVREGKVLCISEDGKGV